MKMPGSKAVALVQRQETGCDIWNDSRVPTYESVTVKYRGKRIDIRVIKKEV